MFEIQIFESDLKEFYYKYNRKSLSGKFCRLVLQREREREVGSSPKSSNTNS